jgi:acyl-CoA thioesterase FadM
MTSVPPPFERTIVVRGYEVDSTRTTPLPVVLSFLEQLRWEWIADPAWGLDQGVHDGHFFVVRQQVLELVERPRFGDRLTLTGEMEKVGRSLVVVRHRLSVDGRPVGHARVTGVWLGPDRKLARLPELAREVGRRASEAPTPFGSLPGAPEDAVLDGSRARSFLEAPRIVHVARGLDLEPPTSLSDARVCSIVVRPSDNDVFGHVNASTWLRFFDDTRLALGHSGLPHRVALDYRAEAVAGDRIDVSVAPLSAGVLGCLATRGDTILCAGALHLTHPFGTSS